MGTRPTNMEKARSVTAILSGSTSMLASNYKNYFSGRSLASICVLLRHTQPDT